MPGEAEAEVDEDLECPECHEHADSCSCDHCTDCGEPCGVACERCGHCDDHCGCSHCDRCGEPVESTCEHCNRCESCCHCVHCEGCSEAVESTCERCNCCGDCCECDHCDNCCDPVGSTCEHCNRCESCCNCTDSNVKFADRKIKFVAGTEFVANPSKRYIAAELEFAGCDDFGRIDEVCKQWSVSVVEDGSLPEEGFELNTTPASGDKWVEMIGDVCEGLDDDGAVVTSDCGYHVHVDARDYDFAALQRLIEVYALIEDALFSCVPPRRRNNQYCTPCGRKFLECSQNGTDPEDKVVKATYGKHADKGTMAEQRYHKYPTGVGRTRYSALNLHSWNFRGTLECRLHHGTKNARNIANWGILWAAIVDWAKGRSVDELPKTATGWDALMAIAPTADVRTWLIVRRDRFSS